MSYLAFPQFECKMIIQLLFATQIPATLAPVDAVERYTQLNSYPLHKTNKPGILSLDIHYPKVWAPYLSGLFLLIPFQFLFIYSLPFLVHTRGRATDHFDYDCISELQKWIYESFCQQNFWLCIVAQGLLLLCFYMNCECLS